MLESSIKTHFRRTRPVYFMVIYIDYVTYTSQAYEADLSQYCFLGLKKGITKTAVLRHIKDVSHANKNKRLMCESHSRVPTK